VWLSPTVLNTSTAGVSENRRGARKKNGEAPVKETYMRTGSKEVAIGEEVDIAAARLAGLELADRIGFGNIDKHCIAIGISELASNIVFHAGSGTISMALITAPDGRPGLQVVASDAGPGIPDVGLALQDGYSTNGGLGCGLPGVARLMSEMKIATSACSGTVITAIKWLGDERPASDRLEHPDAGNEAAEDGRRGPVTGREKGELSI
jgi:serine/threonine-protein kinase RsbT